MTYPQFDWVETWHHRLEVVVAPLDWYDVHTQKDTGRVDTTTIEVYPRPVLSLEMMQLLLGSQVAVTADSLGRYPLHWAMVFAAHNYLLGETHTLSLTMIQALLDHYMGQLSFALP
jgi:hypothetical protein